MLLLTGIPIPEINWLKDGNHIQVDDNKIIVDDEKWSLIISNISKKDAGNYSCVIKNQYGTITHTSHIQIYGNLMQF